MDPVTIAEAQDLQEDLEYKFQELVEEFEEKTGTLVSGIEIQRLEITEYDDRHRGYKTFINRINITIQL